jgi:hypothetical protein
MITAFSHLAHTVAGCSRGSPGYTPRRPGTTCVQRDRGGWAS